MKPIILILFIVAVMVFLFDTDSHDEQITQDQYCEMVALWEAGKHLPPEQRDGWPPYKGKGVCDGAQ